MTDVLVIVAAIVVTYLLLCGGETSSQGKSEVSETPDEDPRERGEMETTNVDPREIDRKN